MSSNRSNSLFSALAAEDLKILLDSGLVRHFQDGEVIFKEGDPGDGLYLVQSGVVRIAVTVGSGTQRPLAVVYPGDFFGEMAVLDNEPRSANAITEGPATLLFLPCQAVVTFLENSPRAAVNLVREFSRRMRDFNQRFVQEMLQADRLSMVGRFASSIVHDFKNPLSIIGMSAELGTAESAPQQTRDSARKRIHKQVDRLGNMIGELLEFSSGSKKAQLQPTNYREFLLPLIEELRAECALNQVTIELANEPPSVTVPLDARRAPNLFFNLSRNAVDAMKPLGGKILIRFKVTEDCVITELEDTGKGIPPQMAGRLFQPFATFGKSGGTGLGLSICQRIVQDHSGTISARSEPGHGAIFVFSLPVLKP